MELEGSVELISSVGEAAVPSGEGDGEAAEVALGDGLALRGEGLGEIDAPGLAVGVEGEAVKLGAGDGLALPVAGVATVAADVGVSDGSGMGGDGVADGAGGVPVSKTGEAETSACETPEKPSTDEARGKERNNKSPTSDRAPA